MRRVLLAVARVAVAAERQAEEIAAQRDEHGHGIGVLLPLPRADVVGLHGLFGIAEERDGRHVPAELRERQLDLRRGENPARLRMRSARLLTGTGVNGEDEGQPDNEK